MARAGDAPGPQTPLLPSTSRFVREPRPWRDVAWLVVYLVVLTAAVAGGIFSYLHMNEKSAKLLSPDAMSDPTLCPLPDSGPRARRGLQGLMHDPDTSSFDLNLFMKSAGLWVGVSAAGSLLLGVLFLVLVKAAARALVAVTMILTVSVPAAVGIASLVEGELGPGISLVVLAGLMVLLFFLWREQVALVCELLGLSGKAVWANPALITVSLGLQLVLGLVEIPLLLAFIASFMNGDLAYNSRRVDGGTATQPDMCVDENNEKVSCCVWQTERWVPAFMALDSIAALWTLFLVSEIKAFVVAGAVAQWYFEPASADPRAHRQGSRTLTSLRHALGPNLGSLCLGSAVLTLVSLLRQALEKARQEREHNILFGILAGCLSFLYALAEFATRFAIVWIAITGESFLAGGRNVVALLTRNFMDAFGVWWLPPMILQTCSFLLAGTWGMGTYMITFSAWQRHEDQGRAQAQGTAITLAVIAFVTAWAILAFFAALLLNAVDALFVCFALDRESAARTRPEVHTVLGKLPTVHTVVENPDGQYVYGAPGGPHAGHGSNV